METKIAGSEVELLVVKRVVGDVHFAIDAYDGAIGVEGDGSVVIEACGAAFEQRGNDGDAQLTSDFSQSGSGWAGDGLGEIEEANIFALTEVLGAKKLGQANDVGALTSGLTHVIDGRLEVGLRVRAHLHLNQAYGVFAWVCRHRPSAPQV